MNYSHNHFRDGEEISDLKNNDQEVIGESCSYYHVLHRLYRGEKTVFIQANENLTFPASDLTTLIKCREYYLLIVNFLGLAGVDAPWWLSGVNRSRRVMKICRQVISHRCYELYYMAWSYTHPILRWIEDGHTFPMSIRRSFDRMQFMFNIRQLLAFYPYRISSSACWQSVEGFDRLGENLCLGQNVLLGNRIVRAHSILRITVGPLSLEALTGWLSQPSIEAVINRLFAQSIQAGVRLCWQCRQKPSFGDSDRCLGKALIYLGF